MGKLGKDVKDLLMGKDGSDKEPDDFKIELQKAINEGIISKSDGTLLITSRMNADKLADVINKSQEKGVALTKDGKVFDSPEEEKEYQKEKEEEEKKRKEREAEFARRQAEMESKKKSSSGGGSSPRKTIEEVERSEEKQ